MNSIIMNNTLFSIVLCIVENQKGIIPSVTVENQKSVNAVQRLVLWCNAFLVLNG